VRKQRTLKYWIGQLHLWLGLASGLVVFIVSLTGCVFVFQQEISEMLHKEWFYLPHPATDKQPLSLLSLQQKAEKQLRHPVSSIIAFRDPGRTWEFMAYKENDTALTIFGAMEYYESVFLDPYTGEVTGRRNYKYDFFMVVKYLHWSLLLNTPYGQPIVGWSTVVFVIGLVTGLVLWWPKKWTKAYKDRSFKIKWKGSLRRVNYDLHNVPGFYGLIPALLIAVTGLVFFWPPKMPAPPATRSTLDSTAAAKTTAIAAKVAETAMAAAVAPMQTTAMAATPLDKAWQTTTTAVPGAARMMLSPAIGKEGVIYVYTYPDNETYYGYDILQYDQFNGQLLDHRYNAKKRLFQRLVESNYDVHVGAIGGLTGKIIAFIASLICTSLPVTGFLVWWLKKNRPRPRGINHSPIV
jgi:uncharacterized iron-regulated membrane protein